MLMVDVIISIVMFALGCGLIKREDRKIKSNGDKQLMEWCNTNRELEYELFILASSRKQYADGRPINPNVKYWQEILWVVNEQLKEKGLRLTPPWQKDYMLFGGVFDENGLCPKNPHYLSR